MNCPTPSTEAPCQPRGAAPAMAERIAATAGVEATAGVNAFAKEDAPVGEEDDCEEAAPPIFWRFASDCVMVFRMRFIASDADDCEVNGRPEPEVGTNKA